MEKLESCWTIYSGNICMALVEEKDEGFYLKHKKVFEEFYEDILYRVAYINQKELFGLWKKLSEE